MMEHIRQFDWCSSRDSFHFLQEEDIDNCVTEKILRNKFYDPLVSDSDEETGGVKIDWDEVFKDKKNENGQRRVYVPGLRSMPPHPKLSSLTQQQQNQCLKVLCAQNPHVLKKEFVLRPTKHDQKVFEELQHLYQKEQQEYIEWAKSLWVTDHCIRALRPKPPIEMVYEAEFNIRANELQSFPKIYELAAQIPLETKNNCEILHQKDLINVNMSEVPKIRLPELTARFTVVTPCPTPEPCNKHPCRFVLPNEKSMSELPLTEVHRELAQYAFDNGTRCVCSENALRSLVERDRPWLLPVSVCQLQGLDGDTSNVVVIGSEFSTRRRSALTRTYRALRHLLYHAFIPASEKAKLITTDATMDDVNDNEEQNLNHFENIDLSSDEEDNLFIDTDDMPIEQQTKKETTQPDTSTSKCETKDTNPRPETNKSKIDFYNCTCKDTEKPPPRSFKKWQVVNNSTRDKYDLIVHCAHKVADAEGEIILEPIPEYQIDLGGSKQSDDKIKSLALSLYLRRNASLLNVRIDAPTGDVVTQEKVHLQQLTQTRRDLVPELAGIVHTALDQLLGLLPGNYVLCHEPSHGANALLYVARSAGRAERLSLDFDCAQLADADESRDLKAPPTLLPVLLPSHKYRKVLPCAFTTNEKQLQKEPKKPITKQKTPPQALKWPRRKKKKKINGGC